MEFYVFFVPLLGFGTIAIIEHLAKRDVNGWRQQLTNGVADSARVFTIYIMTVMFLKNGADLIQWLKLIRVKIK